MITNTLKQFIGKVCTIFTVPVNRNFKDENPKTFPKEVILYFVGAIESMDDNGVLIQQLESGLKSFFFWTHIVGIAEEQLIDEKKVKQVAPSAVKDGKFMDVDALKELAKNIKAA